MNPFGLADPALFVQNAYIDGEWVPANTGEMLPVDNPSTGQIIGMVPDCGGDETDRAIAASDAAFHLWRTKTAGERASLLERWYELILNNSNDLARIMTAEQGKPLAEAEGEVRYGASFVKWFAEEARRVGGFTVPAPTPDRRIIVLKEPIGVAAAITPWNFPNAMITRKVAPALAAGCTMIVKPSELTPFSALALAVLAERAGIPKGVLNIVTGRPSAIGAVLTGSPLVRKISFTGSTSIGAMLMQQSSRTLKRLSLELGGNAPFIVFDDADVDLAVSGVIASKFRNAGQTCVCANRVLVQNGIYDRFLGKLLQAVGMLKVGDGFIDTSTIGPLINDAAVKKVRNHIENAVEQGAEILTRPGTSNTAGRFVSPVVLGGATTSMLLASEETFGPVLPLFRFHEEQEAIDIANGTPFGLAAYFYTENLNRSWRIAERLEFGMVGLNTGNISMEVAPFGGIKQSGIGREGGGLGIEEYLEMKSFHIAGLTAEN